MNVNLRWVISFALMVFIGPLLIFSSPTPGAPNTASMPASATENAPGPKPGDVYWEVIVFSRNNQDWRVTDNNATHSEAHRNLPNAVWQFYLPDMTHSIRAELTLDRTSEHMGTTQHRVRFNPGVYLTPEEREKELRPGQDSTRWGRWIDVPHIAAIPAEDHPENHHTHDNITIEIPIDQLRTGVNTMQRDGTTGALAAVAGGYGQWGTRAAVLRVYFDPEKTPHAKGRITSPVDGAKLKGSGVDEKIEVEQVGDRDIQRVDVLAYYYGYDVDGDGIFREYHETYHQPHNGEVVTIQEHVGTATFPPFVFSSLTSFQMPEQEPNSIKVIARVQDREGFWSVTDEVKNISMNHPRFFMRLYQAEKLPRGKSIYKNSKATSCTLTLPKSPSLSKAESAMLHVRSWNGMDADVYINDNLVGKPGGIQFGCTYRQFPVPIEYLKTGVNVVEFRTNGVNRQNLNWAKNMSIVFWPGPGLVVRYTKEQTAESQPSMTADSSKSP